MTEYGCDASGDDAPSREQRKAEIARHRDRAACARVPTARARAAAASRPLARPPRPQHSPSDRRSRPGHERVVGAGLPHRRRARSRSPGKRQRRGLEVVDEHVARAGAPSARARDRRSAARREREPRRRRQPETIGLRVHLGRRQAVRPAARSRTRAAPAARAELDLVARAGPEHQPGRELARDVGAERGRELRDRGGRRSGDQPRRASAARPPRRPTRRPCRPRSGSACRSSPGPRGASQPRARSSVQRATRCSARSTPRTRPRPVERRAGDQLELVRERHRLDQRHELVATVRSAAARRTGSG